MSDWTIKERKYFAVEVSLASPICVSSGKNEYSDSDVIRNGKGEIFIPGTSLAGAFRNYWGLDKEQNGIMGYAKEKEGVMSSLYISDLYLQQEVTSLRDFVALTEGRNVENKFDMEIVETSATGILFFHYVKRENRAEDFDAMIDKVLQDIQSGVIRFGSKKNRGFGKLHIKTIYTKLFTKNNVDEWISFEEKELLNYEKGICYEEWIKNKTIVSDKDFVKLRVPLKLTGGISIRKYSTKPNEADFEHIMCNQLPVIPGSSWCGVIRSGAKEILENFIEHKKAEKYIKEWFGTVETDEKGNNVAWQSKVIISESVITGGKDIIITRNKINRFDASTKNGALYTENSHFKGETILELLVKKEEGYQSVLGLLKLVIDEICQGQIAVGGQVAVGRGIFEGNGEIKGITDEEECNRALYQKIMELREQ